MLYLPDVVRWKVVMLHEGIDISSKMWLNRAIQFCYRFHGGVFNLRDTLIKTKQRIIELIPDRVFVRFLYWRYQHKRLHLRNPRTYTEFVQWLKIHGRLERYTRLADKYEVRPYIAQKIGQQYLIPLLGVYESFDEIDFGLLPDQFVLKGTHGCEYNVIVKDKQTLDVAAAKAKFDRWMRENFYVFEREVQYKDITPRIVCEQYLEDETGGLRDYKFYCSGGEAKMVQVDTDRFSNHRSELMDPRTWKPIETVQCGSFDVLDHKVTKPKKLREMLTIAETLAKDFPFVRVDLYVSGNRIYFGELTFTPGSGIVTFVPEATGDAEFARILSVDLSAYQLN